jgi:hypothetical protein
MAPVQTVNRRTVDEFFAWDGGGHVGQLELVNGIASVAKSASSRSSIPSATSANPT